MKMIIIIIMYIDFGCREEHLDVSGDPRPHPSPPQPPHGRTHQEQGVLIWRVGPCRFGGREHPRPRDPVEVHQLSRLPKPRSVKHYDMSYDVIELTLHNIYYVLCIINGAKIYFKSVFDCY